MNEDQIKHMVDRFLGWKLPSSFTPDNGISFERIAGAGGPHPFVREPIGTNLFDATQADAMVRYMVKGMPEFQWREVPLDALVALAQNCPRMGVDSPASAPGGQAALWEDDSTMTASLAIMARALQAELLIRGWMPPPIEECEDIARSMVERTAAVAERVGKRERAW